MGEKIINRAQYGPLGSTKWDFVDMVEKESKKIHKVLDYITDNNKNN